MDFRERDILLWLHVLQQIRGVWNDSTSDIVLSHALDLARWRRGHCCNRDTNLQAIC
jgi:hypothetical protein